MTADEIANPHIGDDQDRPRVGGIYWLPEAKAAKWAAIAEAVEAASTTGTAAVYMLKTEMDENAVRAVRDAIVNEVSGEAERINAEITSGELGAKALLTREKEAHVMLDKVKVYEKLLAVSLAAVRKSLGDVETAAAAAAVLAAADADAEAETATAGAGRD